MALQVAIQMDPIGSINPHTDTTLRIGWEAQRRGFDLWYYTPDRLAWREGVVSAQAQRLALHEDPAHYYDLGESRRIDLRDVDVVLLRQDPPFNMAYIGTTYMLETLYPKPLVVNHPAAVRNNPEKWFPTRFMEFMPPTLVSADVQEIESFRKEHGEIVVKPFYGHGGRGVFHVQPKDDNLAALLEMLLPQTREPLVAQKFLPEVRDQDRRIILIDGALAGAVGRIPAEGEIRANFRVGGTAAKVELTPRQHEICEALGPVMRQEGLLFAGFDVIGDWLVEINITSPTGFAAINKLHGTRLEAVFWDAVEAKL